MDKFKIPALNFFQQPVQQIGAVGTQRTAGTQTAGGSFGVSGGSAVDRELADMKRFIPAYKGTDEFRTNNIEAGAKPIGSVGTQRTAGTQTAGGSFGVSGGSAVDRELADMKRFIPAYNGTGELQPNNAEAGAKLGMLYA